MTLIRRNRTPFRPPPPVPALAGTAARVRNARKRTARVCFFGAGLTALMLVWGLLGGVVLWQTGRGSGAPSGIVPGTAGSGGEGGRPASAAAASGGGPVAAAGREGAAAGRAGGGGGGGGWWDSSKSAVIALAAGYGLGTYRQFVGSLRMTGYRGHIILGVSADAPPDVRSYLRRMDVTTKVLSVSSNCTHAYLRDSKGLKCSAAYPDYKIEWGRFPLTRDWLLECEDCTGGVMMTDARDAYFQSDPFAYPFGDKPMRELPGELLVFEEISNLTTDHWLTAGPIKRCRKLELKGKPMLCSGSTMGTRQGTLDYIDAMVKEFDYWNQHPECRSGMKGDDQSIHNYLFYTNRLKNAVSIPHRTGPIHVIGWQADKIFRKAIKEAVEQGHGKDLAEGESFVNRRGFVGWDDSPAKGGKDWVAWLPPEHNLIDPETGMVLNFDGKISPQLHQVDRFGLMMSATRVIERLKRYHGKKSEEYL